MSAVVDTTPAADPSATSIYAYQNIRRTLLNIRRSKPAQPPAEEDDISRSSKRRRAFAPPEVIKRLSVGSGASLLSGGIIHVEEENGKMGAVYLVPNSPTASESLNIVLEAAAKASGTSNKNPAIVSEPETGPPAPVGPTVVEAPAVDPVEVPEGELQQQHTNVVLGSSVSTGPSATPSVSIEEAATQQNENGVCEIGNGGYAVPRDRPPSRGSVTSKMSMASKSTTVIMVGSLPNGLNGTIVNGMYTSGEHMVNGLLVNEGVRNAERRASSITVEWQESGTAADNTTNNTTTMLPKEIATEAAQEEDLAEGATITVIPRPLELVEEEITTAVSEMNRTTDLPGMKTYDMAHQELQKAKDGPSIPAKAEKAMTVDGKDSIDAIAPSSSSQTDLDAQKNVAPEVEVAPVPQVISDAMEVDVAPQPQVMLGATEAQIEPQPQMLSNIMDVISEPHVTAEILLEEEQALPKAKSEVKTPELTVLEPQPLDAGPVPLPQVMETVDEVQPAVKVETDAVDAAKANTLGSQPEPKSEPEQRERAQPANVASAAVTEDVAQSDDRKDLAELLKGPLGENPLRGPAVESDSEYDPEEEVGIKRSASPPSDPPSRAATFTSEPATPAPGKIKRRNTFSLSRIVTSLNSTPTANPATPNPATPTRRLTRKRRQSSAALSIGSEKGAEGSITPLPPTAVNGNGDTRGKGKIALPPPIITTTPIPTSHSRAVSINSVLQTPVTPAPSTPNPAFNNNSTISIPASPANESTSTPAKESKLKRRFTILNYPSSSSQSSSIATAPARVSIPVRSTPSPAPAQEESVSTPKELVNAPPAGVSRSNTIAVGLADRGKAGLAAITSGMRMKGLTFKKKDKEGKDKEKGKERGKDKGKQKESFEKEKDKIAAVKEQARKSAIF